jgi:hypothetical protein
MKRGTILTLLVLGSGIGLAAYKIQKQVGPVSQVPRAGQRLVILYADLREADFACGCGEVIRAVREASRNGLAVQELEPGKGDPRIDRNALKVSPTVVVLGPDGREQARFEGEGPETVQKLRSKLKSLLNRPQ